MTNFYRFGKILLATVLKTLFRFKVFGKENFPHGAAIVASNHSSFIDPPVVGTAAPHAIRYLAREDLFNNPFASWLYTTLGAVPIDREGSDIRSIKAILSVLGKGQKILMFPEGTRTKDGELQKVKPGIGYLVCKARAPVIPTYTHGTFEVLPRHRALIHFSRVVVSFGKPLYFDEIWSRKAKREDYDLIAGGIMQRIAELKADVVRRYSR